MRNRFKDVWQVTGSYAARFRGDYTETSLVITPVTKAVGEYWYHTARVGLNWNDMISFNVDLFNIF